MSRITYVDPRLRALLPSAAVVTREHTALTWTRAHLTAHGRDPGLAESVVRAYGRLHSAEQHDQHRAANGPKRGCPLCAVR